jgi:hypothetical protein
MWLKAICDEWLQPTLLRGSSNPLFYCEQYFWFLESNRISQNDGLLSSSVIGSKYAFKPLCKSQKEVPKLEKKQKNSKN